MVFLVSESPFLFSSYTCNLPVIFLGYPQLQPTEYLVIPFGCSQLQPTEYLFIPIGYRQLQPTEYLINSFGYRNYAIR